jgi:hypothetical protein
MTWVVALSSNRCLFVWCFSLFNVNSLTSFLNLVHFDRVGRPLSRVAVVAGKAGSELRAPPDGVDGLEIDGGIQPFALRGLFNCEDL